MSDRCLGPINEKSLLNEKPVHTIEDDVTSVVKIGTQDSSFSLNVSIKKGKQHTAKCINNPDQTL